MRVGAIGLRGGGCMGAGRGGTGEKDTVPADPGKRDTLSPGMLQRGRGPWLQRAGTAGGRCRLSPAAVWPVRCVRGAGNNWPRDGPAWFGGVADPGYSGQGECAGFGRLPPGPRTAAAPPHPVRPRAASRARARPRVDVVEMELVAVGRTAGRGIAGADPDGERRAQHAGQRGRVVRVREHLVGRTNRRSHRTVGRQNVAVGEQLQYQRAGRHATGSQVADLGLSV